jgi:hypothetical protein
MPRGLKTKIKIPKIHVVKGIPPLGKTSKNKLEGPKKSVDPFVNKKQRTVKGLKSF